MAKARSKTKSKARRKTQAKRGAKARSKGARKMTAKAKGRSKAKGARKMIRAQGSRASAARDASAPAKRAKTKRTPPAAFMKPVQPDSALAAVIGSDALPRTQITKKLWVYIKANGLQDATNRRNINADEKLRAVFNGKRTVNMMELAKFIKAHTT